MKKWICLTISGLMFFSALAQTGEEILKLRFTAPHTAFPDTGRVKDYRYNGNDFSVPGHYQDSAVLLFLPRQVKTGEKIDLIFWFHGWYNNIDTAAEFYDLARQFQRSRRNAVLVLAETAKNAPDSYGGRLEQAGMFKFLVADVMEALKKKDFVSPRAVPGNITLAGHSGAFRVIAYILQNGQQPVQEVFLFDALYAQVDKYMNWLASDGHHHFVHWYTNKGGGTDIMSDTMMRRLDVAHMLYGQTEESTLTPELIRDHRILFVHSPREHNVIINRPDDFQLLLENSFVIQPMPAK
jgi:hypothetical protein